MASGSVFLRSATGLVRQMSLFDVVNLGYAVSITYGSVALNQSAIPMAFPGANMVWSLLIALPLMILAGLFYAVYSMEMPRSGGDYVWVSRTVHPVVGLLANWGLNWVFIIIAVISLIGLTTTALSPTIYTFAIIFNQPGLVSVATMFTTTNVIFAVTTILFILMVIMYITSTAAIFRFLKITFILQQAALFVLFAVLLVTPHSAYVSSFNQRFAGVVTYQGVIDAATKAGYTQGFNLSGTLTFVPVTFIIIFGWNWFAYVGGEVKRASRNLPLAAVLIPVIAIGFAALCAQGIYNVIGSDFINANSYLLSHNATALPYTAAAQVLGAGGILPVLVSFIGTSPILLVIVQLGLLISFIWAAGAFFMPTVRSLFAYSFDRLLPTKLADINDKTHSPVWSIVTIGVIYEILLVLTLYFGLGAIYANMFAVYALALLVVSISGLLYPYLKPNLWGSGLKIKVLGIPAIVILAAASAAIWAWILYLSLTIPAVGGALSLESAGFAFGGMFVAIPWYFIARAYHRSRNIGFELQFKEIPPE